MRTEASLTVQLPTTKDVAALLTVIRRVEDIDDDTWFTILPLVEQCNNILYGSTD